LNVLEKIVILLIVLSFICTIFINHNFSIPYSILISILSIIYLFGGNFLFKISKKHATIKIVSGIILGLGLGTLLFPLRLPVSNASKIIVLVNITLTILLLIIWTKNTFFLKKEIKLLFFRSLAISLMSAFFAFSSIYHNPYRTILKKFVNSENQLYSNFLMFDDISNYHYFIKNKKYDKAIIASEHAIVNGKKWKEYDTLRYEEFSGTYEFLANAYVLRGHKFYDEKNFDLALENYNKADSVYNHKEHIPRFPKSYWNRWNVLKTQNMLQDNDSYDESVDFIINNYSSVKDSIDLDYYYILENIAINYASRGYYRDAIKLNKGAEVILQRDSIKNIENFKDLYIRLFTNYYKTDSLQKASIVLNKYKKIASQIDCKYRHKVEFNLCKKSL
jgi:tetratricopeptide (TPR) repeat protein